MVAQRSAGGFPFPTLTLGGEAVHKNQTYYQANVSHDSNIKLHQRTFVQVSALLAPSQGLLEGAKFCQGVQPKPALSGIVATTGPSQCATNSV